MSRNVLFGIFVLALSAPLTATQFPGEPPPLPPMLAPAAGAVPIAEQAPPPLPPQPTPPPGRTAPALAVPPPMPDGQQPAPRRVSPAPTGIPGTQPPPTGIPGTQPPPPPEPPRKTRGRDLNVQIELAISDQIGSVAPDRKVILMMAADATMGRVRATADSSKGPTSLNVDARPVVLDNDRILLELTVEFAPLRESQVSQRPTVLNESITVILQNGKSMVVSQAADPISDRKMTVEVKATIVK